MVSVMTFQFKLTLLHALSKIFLMFSVTAVYKINIVHSGDLINLWNYVGRDIFVCVLLDDL